MKKIIIITIILGVAGSVYYFGFGRGDEIGNLTKNEQDQENKESPDNAEEISEQVFAEPVEFSSLKNNYSGNNFSFKYPDGFKALSNMIEDGSIVTVENSKGSGFQIFSSVFDESGPITPERIMEDIPDIVINDPKNAQLDSVQALVFTGYDEVFGDTFEVWVVNKGQLYQIVGPKTAEKLITETLETWSWK